MKRVAISLAGFAILLVAVSWWALESSDVVPIETRGAGGKTRSTHVWWVESDQQIWLEAGSPSNGWFVGVGENPRVGISWNDEPREYVAIPLPDATHHDWIRSAIRRKYGFRDRWINLLVDTSRSVAVRLVPASSVESTE